MSNAIKWGLLAAGAVALIALVLALPISGVVNFDELGGSIASLVSVAGGAFNSARGIVNMFLTPWARGVLSGILYYEVAKFAVTLALKVSAWIYHFIFRG